MDFLQSVHLLVENHCLDMMLWEIVWGSYFPAS